MNQDERRIYLIRELINEDRNYIGMKIPVEVEEQKQLLRGLMNLRMPKDISNEFLSIQDEYLSEEISNKGIIDVDQLELNEDGICVWQGDITTLKCDAIVNAANSGMTGCYVPNHHCIDNCIHSFSGIQLRTKCAHIMEEQGSEEECGHAKITPAYNLPCRYIIHTVGPIISEKVTQKDRETLTSCYQSCLEIAEINCLESVTFCCISTGVFNFPNQLAAEIAVDTVQKFLKKSNCVKKVIFNVFKDNDKAIYDGLLPK